MAKPKYCDNPERVLHCKKCGATFTKRCNLVRHNKNIHKILPIYVFPRERWAYKCLEQGCDVSVRCTTDLINHLRNIHAKVFESEEFWFRNMSDFKAWKEKVEVETHSFYLCHQPPSKLGRSKYECNRSSKPNKTQQRPAGGLRQSKRQGSCKLPYKCTSMISIILEDDDSVHVRWISTHYGHELELKHLPISKSEKLELAQKMKSGLSAARILQSVAENATNTIKRTDLITKKDLYNIAKSFNIKFSTRISVSSWIEQCRLEAICPLIFYKEKDTESAGFDSEDFCIIYMNRVQQQMLQKFGRNLIAVDWSQGYHYELFTVMIADEKNEGFPVAFMFTNRKDLKIYQHLFKCIKEKVGIVFTNVFMGDIECSFYNAFQSVMAPAQHLLFSPSFVQKAWQTNLSSIENKQKAQAIYNGLKQLQEEIPADDFEQRLKDLSEALLYNSETENFGRYFADCFLINYEKWAHCYWKQCGIDGSLQLESLQSVINILRTVRQLDSGINSVMIYLRKKTIRGAAAFEPSRKSSYNFKKHIQANQMALSTFQNENSSIVLDESGSEHVVRNMGVLNCCDDYCTLCCCCIHAFSCDCVDYMERNSICVHIHTVGKVYCSAKGDGSKSKIVTENAVKVGSTNNSCMEIDNVQSSYIVDKDNMVNNYDHVYFVNGADIDAGNVDQSCIAETVVNENNVDDHDESSCVVRAVENDVEDVDHYDESVDNKSNADIVKEANNDNVVKYMVEAVENDVETIEQSCIIESVDYESNVDDYDESSYIVETVESDVENIKQSCIIESVGNVIQNIGVSYVVRTVNSDKSVYPSYTVEQAKKCVTFDHSYVSEEVDFKNNVAPSHIIESVDNDHKVDSSNVVKVEPAIENVSNCNTIDKNSILMDSNQIVAINRDLDGDLVLEIDSSHDIDDSLLEILRNKTGFTQENGLREMKKNAKRILTTLMKVSKYHPQTLQKINFYLAAIEKHFNVAQMK